MYLPVTLFWVVGRFCLVETVQDQSQNLRTFSQKFSFLKFSLHFIKISIGGDDQSIFLESGSL